MKFSYSKGHFLDPRQNFMDPCYVDVGLGPKYASGNKYGNLSKNACFTLFIKEY